MSGPPESSPALYLVKGDATSEEIAALTVVLQAVAASSAEDAPAKPRSEWAAHHRRMCPVLPSGPGGWRSSALPR